MTASRSPPDGTAARSIGRIPSGNRCRSRRPTSNASDGFPTPPTPITVTRRPSACNARSASDATSSSRPISDERRAGTPPLRTAPTLPGPRGRFAPSPVRTLASVAQPPLDLAVTPAGRRGLPVRFAGLGQGLDRSLALLSALSFASQLIVGTMLPVVALFAQPLGATPVLLGLMAGLSAIASAGGQLLGGSVSDRLGARRLLPIGLLAYGAASLVTASASAAAVVAGLRSVTGLGSGAYIVGERL